MMKIDCPGCNSPIDGPRLRRLGKEAGVDIVYCASCDGRSWRVHFDSDGQLIYIEEVISTFDPDSERNLIKKRRPWSEGITITVDFNELVDE